MSDTPETDKAEDRDPMMYDDWAWIVPANFARRLERERDEARRELDLVSDKLCKSESAYLKNEEIIDGLKNEIEHTETFFRDKLSRAADDVNEAKRERDEARRELAEIMSCIEQAVDHHKGHQHFNSVFALMNLLENINQRRKHDPR